MANECSSALAPGQKLILDFLSADNPPQAARGLLQVRGCSVTQDRLAGWPLPPSPALPAAPGSVTPCSDRVPAATPAHCAQRHPALLSLHAFAQAVLSAQAACPHITHHLENCLGRAQMCSHGKICPPVIGHHRLIITATNICKHELISRRPTAEFHTHMVSLSFSDHHAR